MINLFAFLVSCVVPPGVTPGVKRKDASPLERLNVKKTRAMEMTEINEILQKKPIQKEINTLGKFSVDTLREFFEHHGVEVTFADVIGLMRELLKEGLIDEEMCITKEDGTKTEMLSEVVANFKTAKLEEQFEMKLQMEVVNPVEISKDDLANQAKAAENITILTEAVNRLQVGVSTDLKTLRGKVKISEDERVVNALMASREELLVSGVNLDGVQSKNGFELGVTCRTILREAIKNHLKDELSKPISNAGDIAGNTGLEILTLYDASDVRALGKEPRIIQGMKSLPIMITATSVRAKEKLKDSIMTIPGLKARDSIPKAYQTQRTDIQNAVKTVTKFKADAVWIRVDLMAVRTDVKPTFKVSTKNSAEHNGKWERVGVVIIREPGMYGRLTPESRTENILVELSLVNE